MKLLAEVVMDAAEAVLHMKEVGMQVHRERMTHLQLTELARATKVEKDLALATGISDFNPRSNKQVAAFLYDTLGLQKQYNRGKPNPTTDDDALKRLAGIDEPAQWQYVPNAKCSNMDLFNLCVMILRARNATKMASTYYSLPCDEHDRFHPDWKIHGTETGRYSCLVHTYPPGAGRSIFVPRPGWKMSYFDFSQIEFRVMIWESGDPVGKAILESGGDLHKMTAVEIFNLASQEDVTGDQRFQAKFVNYGLPYGRGAGSMAQQYSMPLSKAQGIYDAHHVKFHVLWDWLSQLCEFSRRHKYVANRLGRRRYFVDQSDDERERQTQNMIPQSMAHDLLQRVHIDIYNELIKPYKKPPLEVIADMHDALLVEHFDSLEVVQAVQSIFEREREGFEGLSHPCGVKTAEHWGEMPR